MFTARGSWKRTQVPGQDTRASGDTNAGRRQDRKQAPWFRGRALLLSVLLSLKGRGRAGLCGVAPVRARASGVTPLSRRPKEQWKTSHHCLRHRDPLLLSLGTPSVPEGALSGCLSPGEHWRRSTPRAPETSKATNACSDHNGFLVYGRKKLNRGLRTLKN